MRPTLIDLTQWPPVLWWRGLLEAHRPALLAAAGIVVAVLYLLIHHRKSKGQSTRWLGWALFAAALAVGLGAALAVAKVHAYGLMMALGVLAAIAVARRQARRCGENPDELTTIGMIALIAGVLGARLSFVIEQTLKTGRTPEFFAFTSGGLVYDGGLILAAAAVLAYCWRRKLPLRRMLDIVSVSAMIGLAFGRVGCTLNGCCYGGPVHEHFPLGLHYPYAARPVVAPGVEGRYPPETKISSVYAQQFADGVLEADEVPPELVAVGPGGELLPRKPADLTTEAELAAAAHAHSHAVHPAQLYGVANALVLAGLLAAFFRLRTREGQVFALMFVLYPITRIVLEYIRNDNPNMLVTPAQAKAAALMAAGAALLALLHRMAPSAGPTWAERLEARTPRGSGR